MESIGPNNLFIDGCIDIINNMKLRNLIHHPVDTLYLVMIRDYADMLWSSYNFWCKREYDGTDCDYSKWADPDKHRRSPELFHDLIVADAKYNKSVVQPFYYPMEKPCINAGGYYSEYLQMHLFSRQLGQNQTIIVSGEELDAYPLHVAQRIANHIGYNIAGIDLTSFSQVRVNTQEHKGDKELIGRREHRPGLYNISQYRPMLAQTRQLLSQCWREDCLQLAALPPHYLYDACHPNTKNSNADVGNSSTATDSNPSMPSNKDSEPLYRHAARVAIPWS